MGKISVVLATWFGVGMSPVAPGTVGSLAALPIWWLLDGLPWQHALGGALLFSLLAIPLCTRAGRAFGEHDSGHIVIDEVAGMMLAVVGVPFTLGNAVLAFGLFRLFDIAKPWPVGWLDKNLSGGVGVMLDDVAAGLIACGLMHATHLFLGGWL